MKRKLLFAMLSIVSALGLNAQTWMASEVGAGNFYLYNVGKGQFLTRGNGYGTQASVSPNSALTLIVEEYDGAYKLRTNANGDGKGLERLGNPVIYTDQSQKKNATWTFTKVADASNGPVYTIVSKDNHGGGAGSYMTASADNTIVGPADAVTDDYGRWQLVQSWITNNVPVNDANGWTTSQTPTFDGGNVCAEFWNKSAASIKQTLTNLPAGSYELIAVALTREGMTATLNAGSKTMNIATVGSGDVNNLGAANTWFNNGNGVNKLEFTHAGGNLEIGLTADNTTGDHWLVWRSFVLLYKGLDLSALKDALQEQIDAVPALKGTTTTAAYNAAKNYADGIDMNALTTEEAISTASSELASLVDAAKALQPSYSRYATIRDAALAISSNVVLPDVESATTTDAIDAAIPTLRENFLTELPNVTIPADPGFIDVTAVMVDNAGVHTNTDYWTIANLSETGGSAGVCNYGECEFYQRNFKFYQTLKLGTGTWEFGVTGFHRAGNHSTYFYAGEDKILIPGVEKSVVDNMEQAKTYFDGGNGQVALKFGLEPEEEKTIEIGIDNKDTETDKWTIFRNFTLKYYGSAVDYTTYKNRWDEAVAAANEAKTNNPKITFGEELEALNAAISNEPDAESKKADYIRKINELNEAVKNFTKNSGTYNEAFDRYDKVKAGALTIDGTIDTGDADAEFNAATSLEEVSAAVANLRQKFVEALPSVSVPADPGYIDVTDVMVDNASVAKNANFWTAEEVGAERNNSFSWAVCNYDECEFYQQNFKFYQTLKLGTGTWEFGVTGFHRAGNHNTYFYAGEDKILIPGVESSVVNTMDEAKTYFDGGNGQVALKFGLEPEEDGIIEIGIENKDTETDKWTIFRNFTLKYYGSDVDYTAYQARWDEAKTTAENVMAEYDKVTMGNEYNALQDALADAPATGDKKADYNSKINTLTAATNTFKANAAGYLAYANYLQETLDLFSDNFGLAEPTTAEEATDAMHALNVGQYKFVADNYEYSLNGLIGDFGTWEKTATSAGEEDAPQFLNYEHWSGVSHAYYEQGKNGWNSNAWTVKYEKKCKLPAGDYVLKVAARSSAGVTSKMSCSATSKYIALPNYGNSARGINVKGEASWSDEDTFATPGGSQNAPKEATEGGTGAGWQWRFLPFSLNKRTEVTMTFEAEASSQYQWMSIADGELLSLYDIADEVEYADNEENTIENVAIANVTLKREIKKGYNTVVVPFNLGVNDVTKVFGEGSEVYNYSENSEDAEKVTVNFKKGDGSINANVPVLVKATTASSAPVFKGVQVVAPAEELKVEGKNIDFVGSYAPMAVAAGDYFLNEGKIFKSEGKTNMAAFRAYLKTKTAGVKAELFIDGVATSIEAINGTEKPQGAIYNLNGQRVQKAQKGLYIIGGKKVLVK